MQGEGKLIELTEQPYAKESDLQQHLEFNPELLSSEAAEDERRLWLLIKREMGVPGQEDGSDRWSLDHLFVDQDAIPTFVEVKRSSNTEIRRRVVGQMLDYAANAAQYWDAERLRSSFVARCDSPEAAAKELAAFLEDESTPEEFWEQVEANLEERRLRLVFVADSIPSELRSIVEFLNEQLEKTTVNAVEVKQYVDPGSGLVNIVPRIIGETEMARRVKRPHAGLRRSRGTKDDFYSDIQEAFEPELAERVLELYEYTKGRATRHKFGNGKKASAIVWMGEDDDPDVANPVSVRFGTGHVTLMMRNFRDARTPEEMSRLVELLRSLPGTSEPLDDVVAKDYRRFVDFPVEEVLATDGDLEAFKRVLDDASVRAPAVD